MHLKSLLLLLTSIIQMVMGDILTEHMRITPGKNFITIDYAAKTPKENMFKTKIIGVGLANNVINRFPQGERAIAFLREVYEKGASFHYSISVDRNPNENSWLQSKHDPYSKDYHYHTVTDDLALFINEVFTSILWHSFQINTSDA
ncbi:hypothetical protein PGT21_006776 [Puccinia graminis f. sp. tritici]|uniref:Uncharacterized protein n=1 Tax=Puccinia graminis f. sp. tritici TaxID=56615 RepID=A0A5B0MU92_PUCGR|nr:hypothetical protein PGT21_006776 [Puccinia graminis f. sp. tritici]